MSEQSPQKQGDRRVVPFQIGCQMVKKLVIAFLLVFTPCLSLPSDAQSTTSLCAGKGTVDGTTPIPQSLIESASRLFGSDETDFMGSTVFRCMNDEVWLCNYGADLVCGKANTDKINPGVAHWCKENPGAPKVPTAESGPETIYSWKCVGRRPQITGVAKVDARGYFASNWKRLQ
jgi:hypothetical protein